jgi:monothiol glutaredoxin
VSPRENPTFHLAVATTPVGEESPLPRIAVDATALERFRAGLTGPGLAIRLLIDESFEHVICVDERRDGDVELEVSGVALVMDPMTATRADGVGIEWMTGDTGEGFRICNPNKPKGVQMVDRAFLESDAVDREQLLVIDARTEDEYQEGHLAEARLLDAALIDGLEKLARSVSLLFYCNNGVRSRRAAEHYSKAGYHTVYCLLGGLKASS